jgi:chromosome partitioning protein
MDSLIDVFSTIQQVQRRLNTDLKLIGILPSRCNLQRTEAQEILEQLRSGYPDLVMSPIKERAEVTYAHSAGLDIFSFRPPRSRDVGVIASASQATQEFARLADEVVRRL